MFTERPSDLNILFVGNHSPGRKIKNAVLSGDSVTLKIDDEYVLVDDVVPDAVGHFKAIVYGLEPRVSFQVIEFNEAHIFGCHERALVGR